MLELIGEGGNLEELQGVEIPEGQILELQIDLDRVLHGWEVAQIRRALIAGGLALHKIYQAGNTLYIRLKNPLEKGVGIVWWIPVVVGAVSIVPLAVLGWRLFTRPVETLRAIMPYVLILGAVGLGVYAIYRVL